jgi:NodT family efflux transporter outer membrane factor (OMF) lipoprotein
MLVLFDLLGKVAIKPWWILRGMLLFLTVLGGCASLSASHVERADAAVARAGEPVLADWWSGFGDATLGQLVERALLANTDIRSARATLEQARALRDKAQAGLLPSVSANTSAQRTETEGQGGSNAFNAALNAKWDADVFGANAKTLQAAQADAAAERANLREAQLNVAAEVALTYFDLRGAQAQLDIAVQNLASQQDTLQITQWRTQAGLTTTLDVEQARTAVAQTAAQIPSLRASVAKSRHALAVLSGQEPLALEALLSSARPVPVPPAWVPESMPAQVLAQRADVRAAQYRVDAARARVDAAVAARYPSLSLSGSLSLSALTLAGLTQGASLGGNVLGSLSLPLFDAGAIQSQVNAQQAALEKARAAYQGAVLAALQDVQDALVALEQDRARLQFQEQAAQSATAADVLARQRYRSGLVDFQTVLQTQRTLLGTQDSLASQRATVSADHVRLVKALGGQWPATTSAPAAPPSAPAP